ncbi:MAG: hypothetical protein ABIL66_05430, partial [candidate division WOR-3 bacterium]
MKKFLPLSVILFSLNPLFSAEYLIRVDNLQDRNFHIVELIENHTLIIANEIDILTLEKANIPYLILDDNPRDKYYQ